MAVSPLQHDFSSPAADPARAPRARREAARRTLGLCAGIAAATGGLALVLLLPARMFRAVESPEAQLLRADAGLGLAVIAFVVAAAGYWIARRHGRTLRSRTRLLGRLPLMLVAPLMLAALAATLLPR